jgi:hypothetical protein
MLCWTKCCGTIFFKKMTGKNIKCFSLYACNRELNGDCTWSAIGTIGSSTCTPSLLDDEDEKKRIEVGEFMP